MSFHFVHCPSPNHDARPPGAAIDMLVLHYTGMKTADEALAQLCDPKAKVSAHYTVDTTGCVYTHVPEERRAWHAGASHWAGRNGVNDRSIGIELVNPGHELGYVPYTDEQIGTLIELCRGIIARHAVPRARVLGHSDVAPGRKLDPGELFPWRRLAENGVGIWPRISPPPRGESLPRTCCGVDPAKPKAKTDRVGSGLTLAAALGRFGYGVPPAVKVPLKDVISAFQRHFRPAKIDGGWDEECEALLANLLAA